MTVVDAQSRVAYWSAAYGVPAEIAWAVAQRESGFRDSARGAAGEVGVMQLMPATAAGLGVNAYDPEQNIEGGVRLLRDLYAQFGDWSYVIAGYNCGAGCAARGPDRWPASTRAYVAAVVGMPPAGPIPTTDAGDGGGGGGADADLASALGDADPMLLLAALVAAVAIALYLTD